VSPALGTLIGVFPIHYPVFAARGFGDELDLDTSPTCLCAFHHF
jgi:hypothetical protein